MNIDLRHLQLVHYVHELGSLSKCAEAMFISQPAASHLLKQLEGQLSASVFHRVGKKLVLTPVGAILLEAAQDVLPKIECYQRRLANRINGHSGTIRLATQCHTSYHWLPRVLSAFRAQYPQIDVQIQIEATGQPLAYLLDGRIDLAILIDAPDHPNLSYHHLFDDEIRLVMPTDHPLASRSYIRARDLADEDYIMYAEAYEQNTVAQRLLIPAGIRPKTITKLQLTEAIIEMVHAGMGVTALSDWLLQPFLKSHDLASRPITKKGLQRTWSVAMLAHGFEIGYIRDFIDHFQRATAGAHFIG